MGGTGQRTGRQGLAAGLWIGLSAGAWLLGVAVQVSQAELWAWQVTSSMAAVAALLAGVAWRKPGARRLCAVAVAALLAALLTHLRAADRLADALDPALEGIDLQLTGVVAEMPQLGPSGLRFVFEVTAAERQGEPLTVGRQVPRRVTLGWYANERDEAVLAGPAQGLRAGQRWQLPVRLKRPHGSLNPHGFDVELWWWEQGLRANGYVREPTSASTPSDPGAGAARSPRPRARLLAEAVAHPVERLRQSVRDAILRRVQDARLAGVLAALAVGDQAAIERDDWSLYRRTGVAHLMSISGLHVTMFAWMGAAVVAVGWRRSPGLIRRLPAVTAGRWGGLGLAAGYALLAGWGVPAQRTVLMLGFGVLLRSLGLRWPWLLVLLASAVVVTAIDPWAILQPGYWLSFAAVGLLMASEPVSGQESPTGASVVDHAGPEVSSLHRVLALLRGMFRAQAVATIGLAPLSMIFFQQVSVVGFLANLVAIPWVTWMVTPLALLGMLWPELWQAGAWAVAGLHAVLEPLAAWPGAQWTMPAAPAWAMACGLAAAALAVLPLPWRLRVAAAPLVLPLLWAPVQAPGHGRFEAVVADVGQGTAVLVRTRRHLLLYDAGPQYGLDSDAGVRVLAPLLRARGESAIDLLMLSHRDIDHVGGAAAVMASTPALALSSSLEPGHPLVAGAPHQRCDAGQHWEWDGVRFDVLHPTADDHRVARKPNAVSCVLRIVDGAGRALLLTGDIEAPQEAALVERHGAALHSQILVVPHHGSRTSSSQSFLDAVAPQVAVVQAGYRSRFGHPAPDVVDRYRQRGIDVVRTDQCGAWVWHDGAASCTRAVRKRYWHGSTAAEGL